jgi:23S rRNA (adenine2030-N6)-methyltransferase
MNTSAMEIPGISSMNYRHAFHAGNHADVTKHTTLCLVLAAMLRKPAPLAVIDTHAGAGMYDLEGEAAQRSPEWQAGIGRLTDWAQAPDALRPYLDLVAAAGPGRYPGSPWIAAQMLRPQDRLVACELHGPTCAELRATMEGFPAQIHQRDGYQALIALTPPAEPRGLALIDPPFERPDDLTRGAQTLMVALKHWRHGVFVWWRPLKTAAILDRADAEIAQATAGIEQLRVDLAVAAPRQEGKLVASSLLVLNPPFGLSNTLSPLIATLAERLAIGAGGYGRVTAVR